MATAKRHGCMRADDADVRCRINATRRQADRNFKSGALVVGFQKFAPETDRNFKFTALRWATVEMTAGQIGNGSEDADCGRGRRARRDDGPAGFPQRAGFAVTIYEQAPAFSRIGAGIILSANVMKVLRRLGLEQMVVEIGIKANCYVSRAWDTGETMYRIDFDTENEARFGGPYANIHRGDLHAVLEQGVAPGSIAFNHRLVTLDETADAIRLVFANGAAVDADLVIGADGVNSKVREYLLGSDPPRYVGMAAHRAIFPTTALRGFEIPDCTKWWGPDRHILVYFS